MIGWPAKRESREGSAYGAGLFAVIRGMARLPRPPWLPTRRPGHRPGGTRSTVIARGLKEPVGTEPHAEQRMFLVTEGPSCAQSLEHEPDLPRLTDHRLQQIRNYLAVHSATLLAGPLAQSPRWHWPGLLAAIATHLRALAEGQRRPDALQTSHEPLLCRNGHGAEAAS